MALVLGSVLVGLRFHPAPSARDVELEQDQLKPNIAASTGTCGVERWSVKTGTDADAGLVNVGTITPTTIATMRSYPAPGTLPANNRVQPQETTVYSIDATLVEYKLETDSDYHLVIRDGGGSTMITEIADPACSAGSRFLASIQSSRGEFDSQFTATGSFKTTSVPVRVRGIGFFDYLHGQTGVAPNGIELHPVLDIQFNPPPASATVLSVTPNSGPAAGGTSVTISGINFTGATAVTFGPTPAAGFTFVSDTQLNAISPAETVSTVDLIVTTPSGTSSISISDQFTFTGMTSYFQWFDLASAGMVNDNVHLINAGGSLAHVTITMPGARGINLTVDASAEIHATFGSGFVGGPVMVNADQPVRASQRVQYYQTFNEVWAENATQAATSSYINWYDKASAGMYNDNIHLLNPGNASATVTVSLPGASPLTATVAAGAETYVSFPQGTIGGPVTISATQPVLASQRVQYYSSFNEVWAQSAAQAATTSYVNWYDKASAGMNNDNIHLLNPRSVSATVTVSLPGATAVVATVDAGAEGYVNFPQGTIGGPVTVSSTQPVLASQRVQYYQTFNEVSAQSVSAAATVSYVNWYDNASPGMVNDNIHLLNPGTATATVTVSLTGTVSQIATVPGGGEAYVNFAQGTIGGPVHVSADQPVLASQRVQYFSSFNEIWAA